MFHEQIINYFLVRYNKAIVVIINGLAEINFCPNKPIRPDVGYASISELVIKFRVTSVLKGSVITNTELTHTQ